MVNASGVLKSSFSAELKSFLHLITNFSMSLLAPVPLANLNS